jgi:heterotetrameric sarcosine oxidase gamma subunit
VASLIAKSATEGLLPLTVGTITLADATPDRITAVAPWPGKDKAAGVALSKLGLDWPAPDRAVARGAAACLWSGRSQAFLVNAAPDGLDAAAALTDLSDGWTALKLEGPAAAAVLARLVPLDLSDAAFAPGATARTGLGHMMTLIHRSAPEAFTLYVFRSMTASAVHEIGRAMKAVAARALV